MDSDLVKNKMTKDEFFSYFREAEPLKEGERKIKSGENIITTEDLASYDDQSWKNLSEMLKSAGIGKEQLNSINFEREMKKKELNFLTEQEIRDLNQRTHDEDARKRAEETRRKEICSNFSVSNSPESVLTGLDDIDQEYNVVIIDPAYEAFRGYGEKAYTGTGISLAIYKKFGLFGEKHYLSLDAGQAMVNIKTPELKPKIKALIHTMGPSNTRGFANFYEYLELTIKSIFERVKELKRNNVIDEETIINIPLISVSDAVGGTAVQDKAGVYFPRYVNMIKKYFSKEKGPEEQCELINPVTLYIQDEYFDAYEEYIRQFGIDEYWAYDFDGVIHSVVAKNNDETLKKMEFDISPGVLQDKLNTSILQDIKKAKGVSKIKVISGNQEIFKNSAYRLLIDQGVEINESDVNFATGNRLAFLETLINNYGNNIVKYVDDFWGNISNIHEGIIKGKFQTIKFLYWYSSLAEKLIPIDIFKPLPDLRKQLAEEKFAEITTADPEKAEFLEYAYRLLLCYERGYAFPEWSIYYIMKNFQQLDKTRVYYDSEDENRFDVIEKLVREREPANISGRPYYDENKLEEAFNYREGYYNIYYNEKRILPPNIAVFTETQVRNDFGTEVLEENVKIINAIGYAFDGDNQVDYDYFLKDGFTEAKKKELIGRYERVFSKIFQCAIYEKCTTIIFSLIGSASFAKLYKGIDSEAEKIKWKDRPNEIGGQNMIFIEDIFVPAFKTIRLLYNSVMKGREIQIKFMGTPKSTEHPNFFTDSFKEDFEDIGYFPQNIEKVILRETLFVNAWDMLSVPGNGNAADKSLDGFIGRASAIGVLGTGLTNPRIRGRSEKYVAVYPPTSPNFAKDSEAIKIPETTQEAIVDERLKEFKRNSEILRSIYNEGYSFPQWSINYVINHPTLLQETKVYYDEADQNRLEAIYLLVYQREPVNISRDTEYDKDKLFQNFGYRIGYYEEYYLKKRILPPNIAVFTKAGVKLGDSYLQIKIINSIGYAFDSPEQADYKFFYGNGPDRFDINLLRQKYEDIINKIFRCACDQACNTIIFALIGTASFAKLYASGRARFSTNQNLTFIREVFAPVFNFVKGKYDAAMGDNKFTIKFMGTPKYFSGNDTFFTDNDFGQDYVDTGKFPENIRGEGNNLENTLFVNAWDMLSVVGNGNENDESLDGYIGRNTSAAILSTTLTNENIKGDVNNPNYISVVNLDNPNFALNCGTIREREEEREETRNDNVIQGENMVLRDKVCPNLFTVTGGILSGYIENEENNWVVIDPAGEAFQRGSTVYRGGSLSGAIYTKFGIMGQAHGYDQGISYCDAQISNANLTGKVKAMIHAVGPDDRSPRYNTPENFYECLKQSINKVGHLLTKPDLSSRLNRSTQIRIPLISSGVYGGTIVNSDRVKYFTELTSYIREFLCPLPYNIVLGLYNQEEITSFEAFYDGINNPPNPGVNFSSPLKLRRNTKYLSPTSKINNSRNKKKTKIKKLKRN